MRSPRFPNERVAAVAALLALGSCAGGFAPDRTSRAPVLDGYGDLAVTIRTAQPAAAQWFRRGMLQVYAFNESEATRAFKAALAADPDCPMCAWGVAKAAGPDINHSERGDLDEARRYLAWATRHGERATPRERALIAAMSERYGAIVDAPGGDPKLPETPICGAGASAKAHPLDLVYAERMRVIADAYPDDPDVLVLYAEAVMIATRSDWWDRKTGAAIGAIGEVTERLERALRAHPDHPGLNHFLIHAVDSSRQPERATLAADRLGRLAPASPHLLHMPSHIYVRIGRYHDAVGVNEAALAAQGVLRSALQAQGFTASVNWNDHNGHFLWFATLSEGRGDLALTQARSAAEHAAAGKSVNAEFMRSGPLLTLGRLERWDEVLREPPPAGGAGLAPAIFDYAGGVALVRTGRLDEARNRAAMLQAALDAPGLRGKALFGDDPARTVLDILSSRLAAEIAAAEQRPDAAQRSLAHAIELENALEADEPPILGAFSGLALGDLMLRSQRWSDAERAYRAALATQPGNGWALVGLQQALARQGRTSEADRVAAAADRAWAFADPSLRRTVVR
jgi:tetratricopeptide (TPR) repeat protein